MYLARFNKGKDRQYWLLSIPGLLYALSTAAFFRWLFNGQTKNKIENFLAAALKSERQTHTM